MAREARLPNEAPRQTRLSRGWSLEETAEQIRHLAFRLGEPKPGVDGNMISRWERGLHRPGPRYVRLLSLLLDEAPADLGLPSPTPGPLPGRASEPYELPRHASVSDVGPVTPSICASPVSKWLPLAPRYSPLSTCRRPGPGLVSETAELLKRHCSGVGTCWTAFPNPSTLTTTSFSMWTSSLITPAQRTRG